MIATGAPVRAGGKVLRPEPDHKFASLAEARVFCTLICAELGLPPVSVRHRAGETQSHYSPATVTSHGRERPAEIALASWGNSKLVVVHELAHHHTWTKADGYIGHGRVFREAFVGLLRHLGLPGQAHALQHTFEVFEQ
ncbi:hypothetical protein [Aestuariimicrobium ganziense]|uniref:hypothetical protein n=1 Tax=Aestuariimicrobium ganziense TaxID=2773677 RepID=UPI0019425748|nr:hypothetical protein [Aestuariimicrobium ganziense]